MNRQPHVCILCCQHPPDDIRVTHKLGRSFRQAGFRVTWVGPRRRRTGSDYGIDFRYFPLLKISGGRLLRFLQARKVARSVEDVDVYYAVEPDSAQVAVELARLSRTRAVFDIHEVFHGEMLNRWARRGLPRTLLSRWVRRSIVNTCSGCDLVLAVSETVLAPYLTDVTPALVVRSCASEVFAEGEPAEICADGSFTLMQGKSTLAHGSLPVIEAVGIAEQRVPGFRVIMFDAFGDHPDGFGRGHLMAAASSGGAAEALDLRPKVPLEQMPEILRSCDAGIVAYDRTWGVNSLPNKLFEFMAKGLPVIAPIYAKEIRPIIEQEGCGLLVDCEDPQAIAEALVYLREHPEEAREMGRRAREGFLQRHNWQVEVEPLLDRIRSWHGRGERSSC